MCVCRLKRRKKLIELNRKESVCKLNWPPTKSLKTGTHVCVCVGVGGKGEIQKIPQQTKVVFKKHVDQN